MPTTSKRLVLNQETLWRLTGGLGTNPFCSEPAPTVDTFGCTDDDNSGCPYTCDPEFC